MIIRGWALAEQGQGEAGIAQIHQGLAAPQAAGAAVFRTYQLTLLAEAYQSVGQPEAGLGVLAEALALVEKTEERFWEAEIYRLKGELLLKVEGRAGIVEGMQDAESPEGCFLKAIEIARRQEGKSLELRATVSLGRLWQQQGRRTKPGTCWRTSTAGSPRASTRLICSRQKRYWTYCGDTSTCHASTR